MNIGWYFVDDFMELVNNQYSLPSWHEKINLPFYDTFGSNHMVLADDLIEDR